MRLFRQEMAFLLLVVRFSRDKSISLCMFLAQDCVDVLCFFAEVSSLKNGIQLTVWPACDNAFIQGLLGVFRTRDGTLAIIV